MKYVSPALTGIQRSRRSISPLAAAARNASAPTGSLNPSAICAPGAALRICHISVLPTPHSPSGCTCTDSLSEVIKSFTRIGRGGSEVYQRSLPHVISRRLVVNLRGDKFVNAVKPALQFLHRGGIGNANVPIGAERFTGHNGHMSFSQQSLGELHRIGDAVLAQRRPDIGIGIECALRLGAAHARDGAQPRN